MKLRRLVAVCCVMPVLLVGCSSTSDQFRSAARGCMGSLDARGLTLADNGNMGLAIWSQGATADDAECILARLDAPSRVLTKVRGHIREGDTGYTEWNSFRVEVLPGPFVRLSAAPK